MILRGGRVLADVGDRSATAPAARELLGTGRRDLGQLQVSHVTAAELADRARALTGVEVALWGDDRLLGATLRAPTSELPRVGTVTLQGHRYRVASVDATGFGGRPVRVSVLSSRGSTSRAIARSRELAGVILAGFFIIAFGCAILVSRSLQRQIARFLDAARRLGGGNFSATVPVSGRDEFAALGQEFNKMSGQLEGRLEELRQQRQRLEQALQRVGDAFASNLDRDALLEIVLRTAVDGVGAAAGRAAARKAPDEPMQERARIGDLAALEDVLRTVEDDTLRSGSPGEAGREGAWALGHPLGAGEGQQQDGGGGVLGLISVARADREFTASERELFHYLAGQAAVSIENVGLHETVQRQAVTDELTGLYNHRRFQEALASEVERSKRFEQEMGLVMLDIDDFKSVNDTYGHQQGDLVLREVARILRENSREIDAPARYGGEELAVVLPQTDLEGAYNLAERVRTGIEQLELPVLESNGTMSVTASLGVASLPRSGSDPRELVAAADAALYEAKRSGKNVTVRSQ
jgi:diguanylate cyclase (GGDEF)-like protein